MGRCTSLSLEQNGKRGCGLFLDSDPVPCPGRCEPALEPGRPHQGQRRRDVHRAVQHGGSRVSGRKHPSGNREYGPARVRGRYFRECPPFQEDPAAPQLQSTRRKEAPFATKGVAYRGQGPAHWRRRPSFPRERILLGDALPPGHRHRLRYARPGSCRATQRGHLHAGYGQGPLQDHRA